MEIYRVCKLFRALPYDGGVMNQPRFAINRLLAVAEATDRWQEDLSKEPDKK